MPDLDLTSPAHSPLSRSKQMPPNEKPYTCMSTFYPSLKGIYARFPLAGFDSIFKFSLTWSPFSYSMTLDAYHIDSVNTSVGNRFQFPKSIIGNKSNSILELESVSWCADCGIWIHISKSLEIHLPRYWCDMPPIQHTLLCLETAIFHSCSSPHLCFCDSFNCLSGMW